MYVASLRKIVPLLEHANARVLLALASLEFADTMFNVVCERGFENQKPWCDAKVSTVGISKYGVHLPNGSSLWISAFTDYTQPYTLAGRQFTNILHSKDLDQGSVEVLRRYVRHAGEFTGTLSCEQFEEWRDNPFQQKEKDDKAVL